MTMKVRDITGDEFWLRCVFCGDSQHSSSKSHFSVNLRTGKYHCYRCNAGGVLSTKLLLRLVEEAGFSPLGIIGAQSGLTLEKTLDSLEPGPATSRPSALARYHLSNFRDRPWDAFKMVDLFGEVVGVLLRSASGEKTSHVVGHRGLMVPKSLTLVSGASNPVRIVEGPYDVLGPRDVAVGGFLSRSRLADMLPGHMVILCPDGDVWLSNDHMKLFAAAVDGLAHSSRGPWPAAIEFIPDGKDPDECPPVARTVIMPSTFLANVKQRGFLQYNIRIQSQERFHEHRQNSYS